MSAYYNENDPYCAQWLRNLIAAGHIAPGDVDERSIKEVRPDDVRGYTQCHYFAGIGGWSAAARLTGWPDSRPLWTGSCPCQPFSSAARGRNDGFQCERHLWPVWRSLIRDVRPAHVFGEQVANARAWIDQIQDDLEADGYTVGKAIVTACAVGADHIRERIYFCGHADGDSESGLSVNAETSRLPQRDRFSEGMGSAYGVSASVAQLRAYGNAIVPQVAAEIIRAYMT